MLSVTGDFLAGMAVVVDIHCDLAPFLLIRFYESPLFFILSGLAPIIVLA